MHPKSNWLAAAELGLISSTFSTIISQLSASHLGRDAAVDWMTVAAIPARNWALSVEPSWSAIAVGIAFHQWADFSWALFFFGLLGRWTADLRPTTLLLLALPWAAFTSATEWFVLVPLFPFLQPMFPLQQPYWIGLLVHLSSALMYPLFTWLRWPIGNAPTSQEVRVARAWSLGGLGLVIILGGIALASSAGATLGWHGADRDADQLYIRHMTTHHVQGIVLARLGAERARDPQLAALAKLMVASQHGENRIFAAWWQSWFGTDIPDCSAEERRDMPGYLTPDQMQEAASASTDAFDDTFVRLMSRHHRGAVRMADEELHRRGDPRLRIMAQAIRHEQQGEIALMHRLSGGAAGAAATRNMFSDTVN